MANELFDLENLRSIRLRSKLTQSEVADKIGMTRESWNRIEHGQRRLDLDYIPALCKALDCSCAELLIKYQALFREPCGEPEPVYELNHGETSCGLTSDEYAMLCMAAAFTGLGPDDARLAGPILDLIKLRREKHERMKNL